MNVLDGFIVEFLASLPYLYQELGNRIDRHVSNPGCRPQAAAFN